VSAVVLALACASPERGQPAPGDLADSLFARGAYDSAHAIWSAALSAPGVTGSLEEARLLTNLARVAYRRGDYATARALGDSALGLKERLGAKPSDRAETRNTLGLVSWEDGRLADATRLLERAIVEYREAGDPRGIAMASNNLGNVDIEYGRFVQARERFTLTRMTGRALGDARIEGRATTNLAMLELSFGDPRTAVSLVGEARALARRANDPVNEENALGQLALAWAALGDAGRALATADSALAVARRYEMREKEASDLAVLATLEALAGDPDRAITQFAAARALYDSLDLPVEAATVLRHDAVLRATRGGYAQARRDVERALAQHRDGDARLESFNDLLALARLDVDAGAVASANRVTADAERLAADLEGPQMRVALALLRARLFDARGEPAAALAVLRSASPDFEVADVQSALEADWLRTRAHAALGQIDSSAAAARRAVAAIEQVGNTLASLALRVGYRTERHHVLSDVVLTLLRAGAPDEAFRVAESARGDALRADLRRARRALASPASSLTTVALEERNRILREIDALVAQLAAMEERPRTERGPEWSTQSTELARRIREARATYEALVLRQTEASGGIGRPRVGELAADDGAIRQSLHARETVVEFYPTTDTLVVFALTRERLRALSIPVREDDLERRVRLVRGLIAAPRRSNDSRAALESLHEILIRPLAKNGVLAGTRHLVIVAHGALAYLPFAALRDQATGRHLVEDFVPRQLPAASMIPILRRSERAPVASAPTAVFAPFPDRLPATRAETEAVARLRPAVAVHRGTAATEERLRRALAGPTHVHVASHGDFTASTPTFSSMLLARGRAGPDDDGRLELHEVLEIPIRSPLVFLSGCETAVGIARSTVFDRRADVTTLAEAFLLSGAREVVATLWRIDDDGAARFAERFYGHLATSHPGDALAAAQRDSMRDPRWAHPYYWAAYALSGVGGPIPVE
jgi:CHAT domain-containing protein